MGTVDYMAPEQALNTRLADHRADIYSLGCTLHFLLTGGPPFTGETTVERLMAHRETPIPSLVNVRPETSAALQAVFTTMLAKKPDQRYQSMRELITALQRCRDEPEPTLLVGPSAVEVPAPNPSEVTDPTSAAVGSRGRALPARGRRSRLR